MRLLARAKVSFLLLVTGILILSPVSLASYCYYDLSSYSASCGAAGGSVELWPCGAATYPGTPLGVMCFTSCTGTCGAHMPVSCNPPTSVWRPGQGYSASSLNLTCVSPGPSGSNANPPSQALFVANSKSCAAGSIINTTSQVVAEVIPLVGTNLNLFYSSDRVSGYLPWWQIQIPLTNSDYTSGSSLTGIQVSVSGASPIILSPPSTAGANIYTYTAPQVDGSGNPILQASTVSARSDFIDTTYAVVPSDEAPASSLKYSAAGGMGAGGAIVGIPVLVDYGLGSWEIDVHHHYDPARSTLFRGDGTSENLPYQSITGGKFQVVSLRANEVYIFDSFWKHIQTKTSLIGATKYTFSYDLSGTHPRLATIVDYSGNTTTFTYGSSGLQSITSPYRQVSSVTLDSDGNIASVTNPNSEVYQMTYFSHGLLHTFEKPSTVTSTMTYDTNGRLTSDQSSAGSNLSLSLALSATGMPTVTESTYLGRTKSHVITSSSPSYQRTDTDASGLQSNVMEGASTTTYSDNTSMSSSKYYSSDVRFGSNAKFIISSNLSDGSGNQSYSYSQTLSGGTSDPFIFTNLTRSQTFNSHATTSVYTSSTKTAVTTTPQSRVLTTIFDSGERIISSGIGSLTPTTFTYDSNGRLSTLSRSTNRVTHFTYDSGSGLLNSITNALSQVMQFAYDLSGRVTSETLPDSRIINFTYDADGNLASITPPGRSAHSLSYNAYGFLSSYLAPLPSPSATPNSSTQYSYDQDRNLYQITRPDGNSITLNYHTTKGYLTSMVYPTGTANFIYQTNGMPNTATSVDNIIRTMLFASRVIYTDKVSDNSGARYAFTTNTYSLGQIASDKVTSNATSSATVINYTYDSDRILTGAGPETITNDSGTGMHEIAAIGASQAVNYSYSSNYGELSETQGVYGSAVNYEEDLIRDNLGRISASTEIYGSTSNTYSYTYDSSGRLTDIFLNGTAQRHFDYDSNSNMTSQNIGGIITTSTVDGEDKILTKGTLSFAYNANGEMSSKTDSSASTLQSYTYDELGNVKTVTLPSNSVISYKLDAYGKRYSKLTGTTVNEIYAYDYLGRIIATLDSTGAITARYVYGVKPNVPDYVTKGASTYQIVTNHLGSPVQIVNTSTGAITEEIHYDVWGNVTSDTNPGFIPFGFAGGIYDQDTKLVHFGAREYDAQIGRFLTKDPVLFKGGDTNLYGYVWNDPVNLVDPLGLWGVGAIIGGSAEGGAVAAGGGGSASAGAGLFGGGSKGLNVGAFASGGAFAGGPGYGKSYPGGGTTAVGGGYAGVGAGGFITNATNAAGLAGPFNTYFFNSPWGGVQFGYSGGTWIFSGMLGPGFGASGGSYPTNTWSTGGACSQ